MAGIAGWRGAVYQASGSSTTFTNEATTDAGDHLTYTITNAAKRMWDDTASFTVERQVGGMGGWTTMTNVTIDYVGGVITFASANGATDVIRVSGKYFTITEVARAKKWTLDIEVNTEDESEFGDGWEEPAILQGKASGSITLNWADDAWLPDPTAGKTVLVLYTHYVNAYRYELYARLTKDGLPVEVGSLINEELAFTATGEAYYRNT